MSPKAKNKSFPPVKVTEEFLEETKRLAEIADEYLSDYIRKAVKLRNDIEKKSVVDEHKRIMAQHNTNKPLNEEFKQMIAEKNAQDSTHKNNTERTELKKPEVKERIIKEKLEEIMDTTEAGQQLRQALEKQPKSTMVKSFGKGGGKK